MNANLESAVLDNVIDHATPEQRRYLLTRLIRKNLAEGEDRVQSIGGEGKSPIGVFVPFFFCDESVPMSAKEHAVLIEAVRTTREEDLITHEQLLQGLGLEESSQSKTQ